MNKPPPFKDTLPWPEPAPAKSTAKPPPPPPQTTTTAQTPTKTPEDSGERRRAIPVEGLPLDVVQNLTRCTPDQQEQVQRLIDKLRGETPSEATLSPGDIERVRALVKVLLEHL